MAFTEYKRLLCTLGPIKKELIFGYFDVAGSGTTVQTQIQRPICVGLIAVNNINMNGNTCAATFSGKTITFVAPWNDNDNGTPTDLKTTAVIQVLGY